MMTKIVITLATIGFLSNVSKAIPNGWMIGAETNQNPIVEGVSGSHSSIPLSFCQTEKKGVKAKAMLLGATVSSPLSTYLPADGATRINELARALDYDWRKCYDFVRNNIYYAPYFGFMRGPVRTLLDAQGNDADQALLLYMLLKASGCANVKLIYRPFIYDSGTSTYQNGVLIPYEDDKGRGANAWQGLPEDIDTAIASDKVPWILARAGRSAGFGNGGVWTDLFWVQFTDNGIKKVLNPSIKPCRRVSVSSAVSAMNYVRENVIAAAGGEVGNYFVKNISEDGLSAELDSLAKNLEGEFDRIGATGDSVLSLGTIEKRMDSEPREGLGVNIVSRGDVELDLFAESASLVNDNMRAKITLKLGGSTLGQFYMDEVGARNIWISYESSGSYVNALLHADDEIIGRLNSRSKGNAILCIETKHPQQSMPQNYPVVNGVGNVYVVFSGTEGYGTGVMRKITTGKIAKLRHDGVDKSDARMVAASAFHAGHQFLAERSMLKRVKNLFEFGHQMDAYCVGVSGQTGGPYLDIKNGYGSKLSDFKMFDAVEFFCSSLEHAVIEQLNGTNCPAVSTVKILSLANKAGIPICFATKNNYSTVVSSLKNYSSSVISEFRADASDDCVILMPQNANIALNRWKGSGYVTFGPITPDFPGVMIGMNIDGGYNGGYASVLQDPDSGMYFNSSSPSYYDDGSKITNTQGDPISMPGGGFLDKKTDLVINRHVPLSWTRIYSSSGHYDDTGLGCGWSHNFDASIRETTDIDVAFGSGSANAIAPTLVAMKVAADLLADQKNLSAGENARRWTLAALVANWWTKKLCNNSVSVKLGSQMLSFTRNSDGTFSSAPGVTATLTKETSGYVLHERNGKRYVFNLDNRLAKIIDPSGNETRLIYSEGKLLRVENDYEAALTISWNGDHVASVADGAGRIISYEYDGNGCLVRVQDAEGKEWKATYDAQSKVLLTQTNPDGQITIQNSYNDLFQVIKQISAIGGETIFGYADRFEAWDKNPNGDVLLQKYTADGQPYLRIDRDGSETVFERDSHGNIISTMNAAGHVREVEYDVRDNVVSIKEGDGADARETRMSYDGSDRLIDIEDAMGGHKRFVYDACHRVARSTDCDGSYLLNDWTANGLLSECKYYTSSNRCRLREVYEYGSYGLPTAKIVYGDGLPVAGYRTTMTYTVSGQIASLTDANGNTTAFSYDKNGKLLTVTDALGRAVSRSYTATGYLKSISDPMGRMTAFTVTASGNPETTIAADGGICRNAYNAADELVSVTDARGITATLMRDAMGRVVKTTSPAGSVSTGYDVLGNPIVVTNAAGVVNKAQYDSLSRPVALIDGKGNTWRTAYDVLDRESAATTPIGKTTASTYDVLSRKMVTIRPTGARDAFGYDDSGALSVYTNAEGAVYRIFNDGLGRVTTITNAIGSSLFSAVYDGVGNIVKRTDGTGGVIAFGYDACNRLVSKTGTGLNATFAYDNADNLTSAANATAIERFAYDSCNRLVGTETAVGGKSYSVIWAYDLGGLNTNVVYASGKSVRRVYDADGRLTAVSDWLGHTWSMTYDGDGKLLSLTSPDGLTSLRAYDAAGRLASWNVGEISGRSIVRDANGRKTTESITKGKLPVVPAARKSENVHNAADQLLSAKVTSLGDTVNESYEYDEAGALKQATANSAQTITFCYTVERQLASITCAGAIISFGYDALGNRLVEDDKYWIPDFTDPLKRPLMECSSSGAVLRYYIWGGGRLLGFVDSSGALTVAHADDYGSVIALTDVFGSVKWRANYGPHGENCGTEGVNPTPYAWLGGFGVQRLGVDSFMGPIYNTRHRLYSVNQHRFLSPDPMGLGGGLNLYAYGNGNAVSYIDPLGLCANEDFGFWNNLGHLGLDLLGFVEVFGIGIAADQANAAWYYKEGRIDDAALSSASSIPLVGIAGTLGKWGKNGAKAIKAFNNAKDTGKVVNNATKDTKFLKLNYDNQVNNAFKYDPKNPFDPRNTSSANGPLNQTKSSGGTGKQGNGPSDNSNRQGWSDEFYDYGYPDFLSNVFLPKK